MSSSIATYADLVASFCDLLLVCIHTILFEREVYPASLFIPARMYNYPVRQARHPRLCQWIQDAVDACSEELLKCTVHLVSVNILSPANEPLERFIFDLSQFPVIPEAEVQLPLRDNKTKYGDNVFTIGPSASAPLPAIATVPESTPISPSAPAPARTSNSTPPSNLNSESSPYPPSPIPRPQQTSTFLQTPSPPMALPISSPPSPSPPSPRASGSSPSSLAPPLSVPVMSDTHKPSVKEPPSPIPPDRPHQTDLDEQLRAILAKLAYSSLKLGKLPDNCAFTIALELKSGSSPPDGKYPPWVASEGQRMSKLISLPGKMKPRTAEADKTIPVRSVACGSFSLEMWIEEAEAKRERIAAYMGH